MSQTTEPQVLPGDSHAPPEKTLSHGDFLGGGWGCRFVRLLSGGPRRFI